MQLAVRSCSAVVLSRWLHPTVQSVATLAHWMAGRCYCCMLLQVAVQPAVVPGCNTDRGTGSVAGVGGRSWVAVQTVATQVRWVAC